MTDRRQTDGRVTAYSEREREFTFAKNELKVNCAYYLKRAVTFKTSGELILVEKRIRL